MRIVDVRSRRSVVEVESEVLEIVENAAQGPPAIPPETYIKHMADRDNPHGVSVPQLLIPEDAPDGWWLKVEGARLVFTPPPLTEMPEIPPYLDERVKADEGDPEAGYLNAKVSGCVVADAERHVLRLRGDTGAAPPPNCYYGRNEDGVWGFFPIPAPLLPPPPALGPDDDPAETAGDGFSRFAL